MSKDLFDEGDAPDIEKEVEAGTSSRRGAKAGAAAAPSAGGGVGAAGSAAGALPPLEAKEGRYTMEEVLPFKPPGSHSKMLRESLWHQRWRAEYDGRRTSRVCADQSTELAAIKHCLGFLWTCHEEATGQPSPWLFT